jgi:hypothetical protein
LEIRRNKLTNIADMLNCQGKTPAEMTGVLVLCKTLQLGAYRVQIPAKFTHFKNFDAIISNSYSNLPTSCIATTDDNEL